MSARSNPAALRALVLASLIALPAAAQVKPLLDAPVVVAGKDSRFVKTLDLNGDGWTDVMGWWQTTVASGQYATATLRGWINDGTGNVVQAWESAFSFNTQDSRDPHDAAVVGDLDGDGDEDFVITTLFETRVYLSNGAAQPTLFAALPSGSIAGVVLADFDQDGSLELVVDVNATFRLYEFDFVNGGLVLFSERLNSFATTGPLLAADLTGAGRPDLIQNGTRVYPVVAGVIQAPIIHAFPWGYDPLASLRHDVGDVDGDGDLDVVTFRVGAGGGPAEYRILRRTAPDALVPEPPQSGGPARRLFDLDGDGDLDGTCCGGSGTSSAPSNNSPSKFRFAENDGTGAFAPSVDIPGLGSTAIAGVVDMNQDGHVDLVAGRCIYYGHGPIRENPMTPVGTLLQSDRTLIDFDGDGDPDVELGADGVRVNLGDGTEALRAHSLPPAPGGLARVGKGMPGDYDGDGAVDLLVLLGTADAPVGLELLRNVGGGDFESKGLVAGRTGLLAPTGAGPKPYPAESIDSLAADVDGDGDNDLVRRTRSGFAWSALWSSWLRNDGPGGFTFVADFPGQVILDVRDVDGDGVADLFGTSDDNPPGYSTDPLRVAFGLGGGSFGPWNLILHTGVRSNPPGDQAVLADVDQDGDLDIAHACVYSIGSGSVARVMLNDGSGFFTQHPTLYLDLNYGGFTYGGAAATDLNRDGLLDLVFGPVKDASNAAAVFLRKADNTGWDPPALQVLFEQLPGSSFWNTKITPSDPDGDRDVDLVTNRFVRNRVYELPDAGSRVQLQDGVPGLGGIVPTLGAVGPFRVGSTDVLRLRGARPATSGVLVERYVTPTPPPFGGGIQPINRFARATAFTTSGAPGDLPGSGSWSSSWVVPPTDSGRTIAYDVRLYDAAATGGQAISNTLVLSFGP